MPGSVIYSTASRWWERGALRETALLALTVLFGLQLLRVLFAELVFYVRDSLGAGSILPGVYILVLFLLSFLAAPVHRALGPRRALALTAGGLALVRLVEQLVPWPVADLALSTAGTGLFFLCIPAYISHLRGGRGLEEGGHTFAFGLLLGIGADTAIKGVFATLDLSWNPGAVTYVVVVFLFACHWLLLRSVVRQETAGPHGGTGFIESTPLIALGAVLFLQLLLFQNIGQQTALINWDQPLVFIWIVMANAVGLVAAVGVLARPGFAVWPLAAALAGLFALLTLGERSGVAAAMVALLGQVALSMSVAMIGVTLGSGTARRGIGGLAAASALGLLALLVLTYLYYVNYQFDIPGGTPVVPLIAVALILLGISGAVPRLRQYRAAMPGWTPSVAAFVLLLMPLGYLAVWGEPRSAPPPGFPVRVMSYNLHQGFDVNGYLAIEDLAGVIEDQKPDIVAVQEISRGWMIDGSFDMLVWLSRRLDMPYAWGPAGDSVWGNAIFSRYPISEARTQPMPNNDRLQMKRSFTTARIDVGDGESLTVIATHLHNPPGDGHLREPQVRALINAWDQGQRTVLIGDLNASPHDPEILLLAEAGLRDAFLVSAPQGGGPDSRQDASPESQESRGAGYTSTSRDPTRRIDYIWLSADLKASNFSIADSLASDHFGVAVTLDR